MRYGKTQRSVFGENMHFVGVLERSVLLLFVSLFVHIPL